MSNLDNYNTVFKNCMQVPLDQLMTLSYKSIASWDSLGHMVLIASIEETFVIILETDDIKDFLSYEKGKEILKKYGIDI
jgi:acyl carrier protein